MSGGRFSENLPPCSSDIGQLNLIRYGATKEMTVYRTTCIIHQNESEAGKAR